MKFLYTPFGEFWVEEASEVDIDHITRFFTNQQYDKESGLYYYNARYYDPHLGSFISPDPAKDGLNHYAYANSNPIKYSDPTGLISESEAQEQYETEYGDEASSGVSFGDWCGSVTFSNDGISTIEDASDMLGYDDARDAIDNGKFTDPDGKPVDNDEIKNRFNDDDLTWKDGAKSLEGYTLYAKDAPTEKEVTDEAKEDLSKPSTPDSDNSDSGGNDSTPMTKTEIENYKQRVKESKKAHDKKLFNPKTWWQYGFFGGYQYAAGIHGDKNLNKDGSDFNVPSLNSVDEVFKTHDRTSFDNKFPDLNDPVAIKSNEVLVNQLTAIIKSGIVRDTVTQKSLPPNLAATALKAANQARNFFK